MLQEYNESVMDNRHKLTYCKFEWDTPLNNVPCTCHENFSAMRVLPDKGFGQKHIVVYNNCQRTLFAAMRRQLKQTATHDDETVSKFTSWFDQKFEKDFAFLDTFNYSYRQWYQHLEVSKQDEIDKFLAQPKHEIEKALMRTTIFEMFCKREKQIVDSYDKMPKNRAISGAQVKMKHVMGPVCWALEKYCAKKLKGYVVGTNWATKEEKLKQYYARGLHYTIQGDGSAFDTTQSNALKYIDHCIYRKLVSLGKIHHVNADIFERTATELKREYVGYVYNQGSKEMLFSAMLDGTVGSGAPDTTLMNTVRMIYYNRYVMEVELGLNENEYELWASGDDFVCFVAKPDLPYTEAYYKIFAPPSKDFKVVLKRGLGMVLKFLKIGLYEDIDFCSTHVVCDYRNGVFKIVRQLNRVDPLCFWSDTAHHYNRYELKLYYKALADSISSWCGTMPYYTQLYHAFLEKSEKQVFSDKEMKIAIKKINSATSRHDIVWPNDGQPVDLESSDKPLERYFLLKDNYYFKDRVSTTDLSSQLYYDFFLYKYKLCKIDVDHAASNLGSKTINDHLVNQMEVT